jgi:hypothetical protein
MGYKLLPGTFCVIFFLSPSHVNTTGGAVGGGAASRYVSGSDQMMRLLAAPGKVENGKRGGIGLDRENG